MTSSTTPAWGDHPWPGPTTLGLLSTGDLAFLPTGHAEAAAAELDRWRAATTWAQARALAAEATAVPAPFEVEDLTPEDDGDASFDVQEQPGVEDGDWPAWPAIVAVDLLAALRAQGHDVDLGDWGRIADTALNGAVLEVRAEAEPELRALLEAAGCTVVRDDALLARAGEL